LNILELPVLFGGREQENTVQFILEHISA